MIVKIKREELAEALLTGVECFVFCTKYKTLQDQDNYCSSHNGTELRCSHCTHVLCDDKTE